MYKDIIVGTFCGITFMLTLLFIISMLNKCQTPENILKDFAKSKSLALTQYEETTNEINIKFIKERQ